MSRRLPLLGAVLALLSGCAPAQVAPYLKVDEPPALSKVSLSLPISADRLMPLKTRRGVYQVAEGADTGRRIPYALELTSTGWALTKTGFARHEIRRGHHGEISILRETDLRENRQIRYDTPVLLLPAALAAGFSAGGKTGVTVGNPEPGSKTHRGVCDWRLDFLGGRDITTPAGRFRIYRLRSMRRIRIALAEILLTVDFDYAPDDGMVATHIHRIIRIAGLFEQKEDWRMEEAPR
ncbi:MAG: hypothetical protein COV76_04485 [Candidatus Omnitrophica bacterium CG11_big_fil_rev_8_21_14_0_20_64_10]|nr:MAG: hypothetical protein COV76_04485 [Candidatus Omnitrophica bacterium CG11_big_fil_rev_8_21_14_0_20_64_10]